MALRELRHNSAAVFTEMHFSPLGLSERSAENRMGCSFLRTWKLPKFKSSLPAIKSEPEKIPSKVRIGRFLWKLARFD